ncbi:MAG TPA: polyprenyl synthetase family protein [Candidatus Hydrogenedentes bacterium]|nr:polyprenyl synthetase family protein [Candidatus Hydrogenedentota bacterium]HOL75838.1 polyprenyl synthetase family protein [Candidatus Hydrogenedentota bacterium]HPO86340.1 polyprenyl synthetase family protein [Candidatus Hydrogenedentota bacterium]
MEAVRRFLSEKSERVNNSLRSYVGEWDNAPERLREAIDYSLFAGGKRLRPALALGACELVCGDDAAAMPVACALEMIHTYSLIHDDLPAMDNDSLRRGKPTSHVQFGEALAILAGDALLTMAFDIAARAGSPDVVAELARAAGVEGMVGGQVLDLAAERQQLTLQELQRLHSCKTGALIRAATRLGAMLGGANEHQLAALTAYGELIGLAFQIADDILDVIGNTETLGKTAGNDAAHHKATYPALVGIEEARRLGNEAVSHAITALEPFGHEADIFRELARYIMQRES